MDQNVPITTNRRDLLSMMKLHVTSVPERSAMMTDSGKTKNR